MNEKKISKKTLQRCQMLHDVGLKMFLQNGYEKTSLADIVKVTGGSLSTVYEHFGNKEKFFEIVMLEAIENYYKNLQEKMKADKSLEVDEFLYNFGREYVENFSNENAVLFMRVLYEISYKDNGKLVKIFIDKVSQMEKQIFLDYFNSDEKKNLLKPCDIGTIASEFCILIVEPEYTKAIMRYDEAKMTKEQKDEKVKRVVDMFLHGYKNKKEIK